MKKIVTLIFMLILNFIVIAQEECGTKISVAPPSWIFYKSCTDFEIIPVKINIFVHIIRNSKGTGNYNESQHIVQKLNYDYMETNISFNLKGYDYIDNNYFFYKITNKKIDELFNINVNENAIDIYLLAGSTKFDFAGLANGILSKSFIIKRGYHKKSSLPHEMGHCLGLYHTHHGTYYEKGEDYSQCKELVNGTNSETCGDYISDTPADPNLWYIDKEYKSCNNQYSGSIKDINGDKYNPDPSNYMSYASKKCRNNFTNGQIKRMHQSINNSNLLQKTIYYEITGSNLICTQATYTIENLPSGASVTWSSSNNNVSLQSGQGTGSATFNKTGNGSCKIQAEININGTILNLSKDIWVGKPWVYSTGAHLVDAETGEYMYELCTNTHNECRLIHSAGNANIDEWDWTVTGGDVYPQNNTEYATVYVYDKNYFVLKVKAHNECGWSDWAGMNVMGSDCNGGWYYYSISPNPVNNQLHINLTAEAKQMRSSANKTKKISSGVTVNIWNSVQILKTFTIKQDDNISIPVNDLPKGIYYLEIKTGDKVERHKFIKK